MATAPRTQYARTGELDIAYQVFGEGDIDLLMFTGSSIPIDCIDDDPAMSRFQRRLASYCRVIRFDLRGVGLSGHISPDTPLSYEQWADDAISVLKAAGVERASIFAPGTGLLPAVWLAANRPELVDKLIIVNAAARALWAPDYPAGVPGSFADPFLTVAFESDAVERGFDGLSIIAPSVAHDEAFRTWWDRSGNRYAGPSMAKAVSTVVVQSDVRHLLPKVTAPTLVMHRVDNQFATVGHGRYLAEHLPNNRYVELPGADTLHWVGETGPMLDEIEEFLTGRRGDVLERVLSTVLFTDIVGSTDRAAQLGDVHWRDLLDSHDRVVRRELARFRGREVNTVGDGFVALFPTPSRAIECAQSIVDAVHPLGIEVRAGIHAGELELRGDDIAGVAVHIGARVGALAQANEILVSSTVKDLVTGSSHVFTDRGGHELKGVPGQWHVYRVDR